MRVILLLCSVIAVKCAAPKFQPGKFSVPLGGTGQSFELKTSSGGLELQRHKEQHTRRTDHWEETEHERRDVKDPDHISEFESERNRTHDSKESLDQTEDSGVKLSLTGVQLYNDTSSVAERSSVDSERGSRRGRGADKSSVVSSGSEYARTNTSREHHEQRQHTALDLNGDFITHGDLFTNANVGDMFNGIGKGGSGDVLTKTGRGKGGNATRETMTLDTHEGTQEESERSWKKTKDYVKDGNQTRVKTTVQASNHTTASKESSKNETHEKEIKIIKGDDEKAGEINNGGESNDCTTNRDDQDNNRLGNSELSADDGTEKNKKDDDERKKDVGQHEEKLPAT